MMVPCRRVHAHLNAVQQTRDSGNDQRMRSVIAVLCSLVVCSANAETLRHPETLEQQLKSTPISQLAAEAQRRGDARRGALVFYKSAAACVSCHSTGETKSPLGPDLTVVGQDAKGQTQSDEYLIESLLHPSKSIRGGFETAKIINADGDVVTGLLIADRDDKVILRDASNLDKEVVVDKEEIEAMRLSDKSLMPEGLVASIPNQGDFLDLAKYVIEVARGGAKRARELKPTPEQLEVKDDSIDLDHAGIIKKLRSRDFETGQKIYHGYCFNCHGNDGNTPSLPTARAFGSQKLKFGADPYSMFMTLTKGNGLMAPMSHLTPKERYQVVHYIREAFMKDSNPDYKKVKDDYLKQLPEGTKDGTYVAPIQRDYGPALASQLRREFSSVLSINLGDINVSYDLNSMDQAGVWSGGFLDLKETQHARDRGEGTANPAGDELEHFKGWRWGHDGTLDYPTEGLLKRGPMPSKWMDYHGHYLHGNNVVLSYAIDGREILQAPAAGENPGSITQTIWIGPGKDLILCAAEAGKTFRINGQAASVQHSGGLRTMIADLRGASDLSWEQEGSMLVLRIPESGNEQIVQITLDDVPGDKSLGFKPNLVSPKTLIGGGPQRWPEVLKTTGYLGLERGAYALDTITIPKSTPWNTWFRTSALDFFSDGRMAVSTYGGDVWIVSNVDNDLTNLHWKRFAGGLYEPFGLKIVDDQVFVTCKDRLTRLHDLNDDGEADFYESFSADPDVSVNFHAFNFDLQTDADGNFYYAKSGHGGDSFIPGCVIKITPDGKQRSVYCTGFRTPNGMGALPDGRVTASDNQGQWTPAGKISLLKPGGFYGWVANYSIPGMWEPGEGTIDLEKVVAPKTFDQPLVWMPQEFDNSSGGQLFVDDPRWGPLSGRLLHTSFGKGWMSYLMMQHFRDISQAAIVKLPFDFQTGIMRARVNPADGQVYATGLQGWNGGGRQGLLGYGIQRLRYTGKPILMLSDCQVEPDGLRLEFNFPLDKSSAEDITSYQTQHWNYRWQKSYGSDQYKPSTGKKGVDKLNIVSVELSDDRKTVKLKVPDIKPVNQVHMIIDVKSADAERFQEEVYWTINRVP